MEISEALALYFMNKPYKDWNLPGCLEFLGTKCPSLTSADQEHIQEEFKCQVLVLMKHQSISKSARAKVSRLYDSVPRLFMLEEVSTFFKRMDAKVHCCVYVDYIF